LEHLQHLGRHRRRAQHHGPAVWESNRDSEDIRGLALASRRQIPLLG
jgi:hypothetical protein